MLELNEKTKIILEAIIRTMLRKVALLFLLFTAAR
jgi:hypothetical protein